MAPRTYQMTRRAAAAADTRRRIVEACAALHSERGLAATTMKDIAARADVGLGTVYHHFATYDDVIVACRDHSMAVTPFPSPAIFDDVEPLAARLQLLTGELFTFYERFGALDKLRPDRSKFPVLDEALADLERQTSALVAAAIRPARRDAKSVAVAVALVDYYVYRNLTTNGFSRRAAATHVAEVLDAWLAPSARRNKERT
jgi:AcrR family transcriptional regulator